MERAQRQHPGDVKENEIGEEEKNGERDRGRGRRKTVISSLFSSLILVPPSARINA